MKKPTQDLQTNAAVERKNEPYPWRAAVGLGGAGLAALHHIVLLLSRSLDSWIALNIDPSLLSWLVYLWLREVLAFFGLGLGLLELKRVTSKLTLVRSSGALMIASGAVDALLHLQGGTSSNLFGFLLSLASWILVGLVLLGAEGLPPKVRRFATWMTWTRICTAPFIKIGSPICGLLILFLGSMEIIYVSNEIIGMMFNVALATVFVHLLRRRSTSAA